MTFSRRGERNPTFPPERYSMALSSDQVFARHQRLHRLAKQYIPPAADARMAGAVRRELEVIGRPIGPCDLLIAGQARR